MDGHSCQWTQSRRLSVSWLHPPQAPASPTVRSQTERPFRYSLSWLLLYAWQCIVQLKANHGKQWLSPFTALTRTETDLKEKGSCPQKTLNLVGKATVASDLHERHRSQSWVRKAEWAGHPSVTNTHTQVASGEPDMGKGGTQNHWPPEQASLRRKGRQAFKGYKVPMYLRDKWHTGWMRLGRRRGNLSRKLLPWRPEKGFLFREPQGTAVCTSDLPTIPLPQLSFFSRPSLSKFFDIPLI